MKTPLYIVMSALFFVMLLGGFMYSYIFYPNHHPIGCVIKKYTGKDCPSCGFSKAFSYYSHLKIAEGRQANEKSFSVLLFFLFQFTLRLAVLLWYFTTHKVIANMLIKSDLIISISFFLLAFLPLLILNH